MVGQYGWMGKILRLDLAERASLTVETSRYAAKYIGGRGIAARIAWEELNPGIDAYAPENRLIVMTGPLTGTVAPSSGRVSFSGVAPQAYPKPWYTRSNMGGFFGAELKYAGYDGLIITGKAERPTYVYVNDDEVQFLDADEVWGRDTFSTQRYLVQRHGEGTQVICIGPAGEHLVRLAVVQSGTEHAAGQGGFGAVMGSKRLKAVAVKGSQPVPVAKPKELIRLTNAVNRQLHKAFREGAVHVDPVSARRYGERQRACTHACAMGCGAVYGNVPGTVNPGVVQTRVQCCAPLFSGKAPFYDWDIGAEAGVEVSAVTNELGLNHWSLVFGIIPWLRECQRRGLIKDLDGTPIDFHDPVFWATLLKKIAYRDGVGDKLAEDGPRASDALGLGKEIIDSLYPAYGFGGHWDGHGDKVNPPFFPIWLVSALQWATDTRDPFSSGHDYASNLTRWSRTVPWEKLSAIGEHLYGSRRSVDPATPYEWKAQPAIQTQHESVLKDSLPLCDNIFPLYYTAETEDNYVRLNVPGLGVVEGKDLEYRLYTAVTGRETTQDEFNAAAERVYNLERAIQVRDNARTRMDDERIIPYFETPETFIGPSGKLEALDRKQFLRLLDEYYALRGWDLKTGRPTKAKLEALGLGDVAKELGELIP
ncbi:MAG: aldehyde ferredoxin oxidoreductase N-terminal domain-containing protein [Candidatus Bathyarchaeia archaeon]